MDELGTAMQTMYPALVFGVDYVVTDPARNKRDIQLRQTGTPEQKAALALKLTWLKPGNRPTAAEVLASWEAAGRPRKVKASAIEDAKRRILLAIAEGKPAKPEDVELLKRAMS